MVKKTILLLFVSSCLYAQSVVGVVTTYYLVYAKNVSSTTLTNLQTYGKHNLADVNGQPMGLTILGTTPTTNYYVLGISTSSRIEQNTIFANAISVRKLSQKYVWKGIDGRTSVKVSTFMAEPNDYYVPYVVHVTTP